MTRRTPIRRTRFAWFFLRTLARLELPAIGVGEQAFLNGRRVVAEGRHRWNGFARHTRLADNLWPPWSPAQQQTEPMAGTYDDEGGPDHEQDDFEQPTAFAEEATKAFELGAEGLDG